MERWKKQEEINHEEIQVDEGHGEGNDLMRKVKRKSNKTTYIEAFVTFQQSRLFIFTSFHGVLTLVNKKDTIVFILTANTIFCKTVQHRKDKILNFLWETWTKRRVSAQHLEVTVDYYKEFLFFIRRSYYKLSLPRNQKFLNRSNGINFC